MTHRAALGKNAKHKVSRFARLKGCRYNLERRNEHYSVLEIIRQMFPIHMQLRGEKPHNVSSYLLWEKPHENMLGTDVIGCWGFCVIVHAMNPLMENTKMLLRANIVENNERTWKYGWTRLLKSEILWQDGLWTLPSKLSCPFETAFKNKSRIMNTASWLSKKKNLLGQLSLFSFLLLFYYHPKCLSRQTCNSQLKVTQKLILA